MVAAQRSLSLVMQQLRLEAQPIYNFLEMLLTALGGATTMADLAILVPGAPEWAGQLRDYERQVWHARPTMTESIPKQLDAALESLAQRLDGGTLSSLAARLLREGRMPGFDPDLLPRLRDEQARDAVSKNEVILGRLEALEDRIAGLPLGTGTPEQRSALRAEMTEVKRELTKTQQRLETAESNISQNTTGRNSMNRGRVKLEQSVSEAKKTAREAKSKVDTMSGQLQALDKIVNEDLRAEITRLSTVIAEQNGRLSERLAGFIVDQTRKWNEHTEGNKQVLQRLGALEADMNEMKQDRQALLRTIANDRTGAKEMHEALQEQIDFLLLEQDTPPLTPPGNGGGGEREATRDMRVLRAQFEAMNAKQERLETEMRQMTEQRKETASKISNLNATIVDIQTRLGEIDNETTRVSGLVQALDEQITMLDTLNRVMIQESNMLRNTLMFWVTQTMQAMQEQYKNTNERLTTVSKRMSIPSARLVELSDRIAREQGTFNRYRDSLDVYLKNPNRFSDNAMEIVSRIREFQDALNAIALEVRALQQQQQQEKPGQDNDQTETEDNEDDADGEEEERLLQARIGNRHTPHRVLHHWLHEHAAPPSPPAIGATINTLTSRASNTDNEQLPESLGYLLLQPHVRGAMRAAVNEINNARQSSGVSGAIKRPLRLMSLVMSSEVNASFAQYVAMVMTRGQIGSPFVGAGNMGWQGTGRFSSTSGRPILVQSSGPTRYQIAARRNAFAAALHYFMHVRVAPGGRLVYRPSYGLSNDMDGNDGSGITRINVSDHGSASGPFYRQYGAKRQRMSAIGAYPGFEVRR